ncbi:MAG TPA: DUF4129 domain-containing protein [Pirellulales bacterium]|jgi:hypothetical protein
MARKRPEPTLADYMAIAIGPALIIVLVSSVAFFLLTLSYAGAFEGVTQWTMGCFCVAAVLISRVSINEGAERAAMFGLALMGAVGLAMVRYLDKPWIAWIVLGVIWSFASHLVWNCTVVDDADDASGEGLLEAAGLEGNEPTGKEASATADAKGATAKLAPRPKQFPTKKEREKAAEEAAAAAMPPPPPIPLWRRLWAWWQRGSSRTAPPGIWVIYCSLVALPIFGFGQWFMDRESRDYGFRLMFRYVAAAMLLLLTTSFLGLRRYLRQRKLEMPMKMAGVWLGSGAAMVAAILLLAMLIPRPNPDYSLASLGRWLTSPKREASDHSVLKKSTGEGDSESTAPADDKEQSENSKEEKPGNESQKTSNEGQGKAGEQSTGASGQPPAEGKQPSQGGGQQGEQGKQPGDSQEGKPSGGGGESKLNQPQPGEQKQGEQQQSEPSKGDQAGKQPSPETKAEQEPSQDNQQQTKKEQAEAEKEKQEKQEQEKQKEQSGKTPGKSPPPPPPNAPKSSWTPSFGWLGTLLKFLLYLAAAIVVIYYLIRYWDEVRDWLAKLWQEFLDIWNNLFGGRKKEAAIAAAAAEEAKPKPRPFAAFRDPFQSGDAARSKPSAVVQYSFEALEAWAIERGLPRLPEETPLEFAGRLSTDATMLGGDAAELATLYARVAYARDPLSGTSLGGVERLWKTLRRTATPPNPVS